MQYLDIPHTNLKVSIITLGTWVFDRDSWGGGDEKDSQAAVQAALDMGITLIDTAPVYGFGMSEEIVGRAIKGRRDQVLIATKCGLIWKGRSIRVDLSPASIENELDASLKRLGTDVIDIYQCHWPDPNTPIRKTMETLVRLKNKKKIRYIGVSNFDANLLKKAVEITPVATIQNQYSMLERTIEKDVLAVCREQGIGVLAYGPLAGGILSGKYQMPPDLEKEDARSFFYKYYSGASFEKTKNLLEELKKIEQPLNQIAINWVRQQPEVSSVIVGCRNAEQVRQNVAASDWDLTAEQLDHIRQLSDGV